MKIVLRAILLQVLIAAVAKLFRRRLGWLKHAIVAVVQLTIFPHFGARKLTLPDDKEVRKQWARALLSAGGSSEYSLAGLLSVEDSPSPNRLICSTRNTYALQNFMGSMHGGAQITIVDQVTTALVVAAGGFPGVSVSMGMQYMAGCAPGETVRVEASMGRLGGSLAYTTCRLYRGSDGTLMAQGHHTKYVRGPWGWGLIAAMPPSLALWAFRSLTASAGGNHAAHVRAADAASDVYPRPGACTGSLERCTLLPLSDVGKREYFAMFGDGTHYMQGFDGALQGALQAGAGPTGEAAAWNLAVDQRHANPARSLHGGCTAAVVDVLGTALIALGNDEECGVAINLEVEYMAAAPQGQTVRFEATMLKRGRRLAFVQVLALGHAGRLLARGTVTKSLRGSPKTAATG